MTFVGIYIFVYTDIVEDSGSIGFRTSVFSAECERRGLTSTSSSYFGLFGVPILEDPMLCSDQVHQDVAAVRQIQNE